MYVPRSGLRKDRARDSGRHRQRWSLVANHADANYAYADGVPDGVPACIAAAASSSVIRAETHDGRAAAVVVAGPAAPALAAVPSDTFSPPRCGVRGDPAGTIAAFARSTSDSSAASAGDAADVSSSTVHSLRPRRAAAAAATSNVCAFAAPSIAEQTTATVGEFAAYVLVEES